jgi:EEF1A lysine methyltransferase 1
MPSGCSAVCLEYDTRFQIFGQSFVPYDYNQPLNLPAELEGAFDIVVADPPFLSEECLRKTALTVRYLTKKNVILCTGLLPTSFQKYDSDPV